MNKLVIMLSLLSCNLFAMEKIYIDKADVEISEDVFYIHEGANIYREAQSIYADKSGLYIVNLQTPKEYERKWKCPYCHMLWPIKVPCQNEECPSKYARIKGKQ